MATPQADKFSEEVLQELSTTPYACSSLKKLSGGSANFIFKAVLTNPLPDGTTEVAVKHGEDYVASMPDFQIPTTRCVCPSLSRAKRPLPVADRCLASRGRVSKGARWASADHRSILCPGS